MKRNLIYLFTIFIIAVATAEFLLIKIIDMKMDVSAEPVELSFPKKNSNAVEEVKKVVLSVPYISEAPRGIWSEPWVNGCEEASIAMVEKYYLGRESVSIEEAESFMQILFDAQDLLYGSNRNADSVRVARLISDYASFNGVIKDNPTLEEIKNELWQNHPVIAFHYGFALQNKNILFLATGSSYHNTVIIGYDDATREFIVNDSGDEIDGQNHRYSYDLFMNSLRDYDFSDNKADGPARVIFTSPKN